MRINRVKRKSRLWQKLAFWRKPKSFRHWKWWVIGGGVFGLSLLSAYTMLFLPDVHNADQLSFSESTIIYARGALDPEEEPNDHILYTIHGDENREYIPLGEISPWVKKATIAIEDDQFYRHFGFDIGGIVKGALNHFFGLGSARGGSTITQQLVKNTFLNNDRSVIRKINELLLSVKLEFTYSKDEILELYLNKIPYGNNAFGIEAAAKTYFDKSARDLTIAEAAILASIPVAPTRFNPFGSNRDLLMGFYEMEASFQTEAEARAAEAEGTDGKKVRVYKKGRKDLVLQRMLDLKMINQQQFQQAWGEALSAEFKTARTDIQAPHFVFYVRERLEEKYGKEFLNQGGLRIYTTLDLTMQTEAERIVAEKTSHYTDTYGAKNLALTAIKNGTGEIMAYIGGKDFFDEKNDGQVDVLTSRRQPGSSFKPLVYATGFSQGMGPATVVFDVETDFGAGYTPQNFNEVFSGPVSFRRALNASLNIPAIKMAALAGPRRILSLAAELGIKYEGDADMHGVAVGVGVAEVEPLSHINAFQAFAGDGSWYEPTAILEIRNAENQLLEKTDLSRRKQEGLDPDTAALVRNILTDEASRPTTDGFDWNRLLQLAGGYNNGAKTGTSNRVAKNPEFNADAPESDENRRFITVPGDSWTIGFTPDLVTGVWVGNNRGEPMRPGATGLTVAAPVWKTFTEASLAILEADPDKPYIEERPLRSFSVNKFSGKLATENTPPELVVSEVFARAFLPTQEDDSVQDIEINIINGLPADEETPEALRQSVKSLVLTGITPERQEWQAGIEAWLELHPKFMTSLGQDLEEGWDPPAPETLVNANRQERTESFRERLERLNRIELGLVGPPPTVKILSPSDGGLLAPGPVEIRVSVTAPGGVEAVEFYFDDQFVDEATRPPYTGEFRLPSTYEIGSEHTLKVIVTDRDYQTRQAEATIKVGRDQTGPNILFLSPIGSQQIPINSLYQIQVEVEDEASAIAEVQFKLDDQSLQTLTSPPYQVQLLANTELGRKYVRVTATDVHGNQTEKSIPVNYVREKLINNGDPEIVTILSNRHSLSVEMVFPEPSSLVAARLVVSASGSELYSVQLNQVSKTANLSLSRAIMRGSATVELQIDSGSGAWTTVDSKVVNF